MKKYESHVAPFMKISWIIQQAVETTSVAYSLNFTENATIRW
jgi:hypothetical protein